MPPRARTSWGSACSARAKAWAAVLRSPASRASRPTAISSSPASAGAWAARRSTKALIWLSGRAPVKPSTGRPSTKAKTAGIDWTRSWPANCGCWSISIFTSFTFPRAAVTARSMAGPNCLQGPHQGAQKSTMTGVSREASITSAMKPVSVPSLISPGGVAPAGGPEFSPISAMGLSMLDLRLQDGPSWPRLQRVGSEQRARRGKSTTRSSRPR